jgi:pimeloyl-ACP methyl ester carboxylesterase
MKLAIERVGSGEPLVLIHGMGSAATAWKPLIPKLIDKFEVITIDLPGHGRTPLGKTTPMDPESLAKLVVQNLTELDIEQFHLVGNSLGGWISLEIAAIYPERVITLTGLAPAGLWLAPFTSRYPGELAVRLMAKGLEKVAPTTLNYKWAKKIGFETVSPRWQELSYEICLDAVSAMAKSDGYFPACDGMLKKRFDKYVSNEIPITIIFGDTDHTLPAKTCQERSLAPDHAKWIILPETGHAPMWDSTEEVLAEILETSKLRK